MNRRCLISISIFIPLFALILVSCNETKCVEDGDRLYTGLKKITYTGDDGSSHAKTTREEVEAALQTKPNGSLFGSSYYRSPFRLRLWIWNTYSRKSGGIAKWMTKNFGKPPVLMSQVNPELRTSIAETVLKNHGYFNGKVTYQEIDTKNPKKAKLSYNINTNDLYYIDTLRYTHFTAEQDSIIDANQSDALVKSGSPFDASTLSSERDRVALLLRNNGYYFYQSDYASYLADSLSGNKKMKMELRRSDSLSEQANHKWYIGNVNINLKRMIREDLTDSIHHRHLKIKFNGKKPPIRPSVLYRDLKIHPRDEYSYDNYYESSSRINSTGSFALTNFQFTPRDSSATCDTLDFTLDCILDKPYDFYVETNFVGKTSGRMGPQLVIGLDKRNAFRGGEKLSIDLSGSFEWQSSDGFAGLFNFSNDAMSYEYGGDIALELPRFFNPFRDRDKHKRRRRKRTRYYSYPTTMIKLSANVVNRADYFRMHTFSGQLTYSWQKTATSAHEFSPLIVEYQFKNATTAKFDSLCDANPYLRVSMDNQFLIKMKYSYVYKSPSNYMNPILWQASVSESGNIVSLGYMITGRSWGEKQKEMFKNPYAQFFKFETSLRKIWTMNDNTQLVGHVSTGILLAYGNSSVAPYSEQFYAGGANGVRAFQVRSIGPGSYVSQTRKMAYVEQTGDFSFLANLEMRYKLFGSLYTALFLDAGNVWSLHDDDVRDGATLKANNFFKEIALGTGIGIRYDLDFLILRLDWGIALHTPYDTGKSGYFNTNRFADGQCLHLAVGMPF